MLLAKTQNYSHLQLSPMSDWQVLLSTSQTHSHTSWYSGQLSAGAELDGVTVLEQLLDDGGVIGTTGIVIEQFGAGAGVAGTIT